MLPRRKLLLIVALGVPLLIAGMWSPPVRQLVLLYNVAWLLLAVIDRLVSPRLGRIVVTRETSDVLSVGTTNPVTLVVRSPYPDPLTLELADEYPEPGSVKKPFPLVVTTKPGQEVEALYEYTPRERGRKQFAAVHVRVVSQFGFWTLSERRELVTPVRVLPDIRSVTRYELLARRNRLDEVGIRMQRLRGQGAEFERLREYRRGDELRQIDWKATARQQELISREFNVERNQSILLAVDCGRSMLNESDQISYLDRALNASVMLSYIALGQSDNVGFAAFSSSIERSVKPVRGKPAIQTILQNSFDLQPRRETSDYALMMEHLTRTYRKRSLVIFITHVIDEQHLEAISKPLRSVRSPHLFLCVFLRDLGLNRMATRVPGTELEAFQTAAAAELLVAVERQLAVLRDSGVLAISTLPEKLTTDLINEYLSVKARGLI